jgi:hypothetical protein
MIMDKTNPLFLLHRKEPMSGILCLEDMVITGETNVNNIRLLRCYRPIAEYEYTIGRGEPDKLQYAINRSYDIDRNTLETVMLATDGYVGKWVYNGKEGHYKIIGLWHLQYKPVKKSRASDRPHAIFMGPRDRAAFNRVRGKTP